jgi:hypothetical protein
MMQFVKISFVLFLSIGLSACFILERSLTQVARDEVAWVRTGFDPEMVESELWDCAQKMGFNPRVTRDLTLLPEYEMCMLNKGFRYIDSPTLSRRGWCSSAEEERKKNRPSCQSLRGDLKVVPNNPVTPEQAAIRMVEDSPRPNGVPAFTVKCLYSLTCYNALERAEPGRVQKVIDALPDDVRTRLLNGGYWTPAAKNNRSPLFPKEK